MVKVCKSLKTESQTTCKALLIFHTFCHLVSFKSFDRYFVSMVCVILACKDDDRYQNLKKYIDVYLVECQK